MNKYSFCNILHFIFCNNRVFIYGVCFMLFSILILLLLEKGKMQNRPYYLFCFSNYKTQLQLSFTQFYFHPTFQHVLCELMIILKNLHSSLKTLHKCLNVTLPLHGFCLRNLFKTSLPK